MRKNTGCQGNTGKRINLYGKGTGSFIPDWLDEWKGITSGAKRVYGKLVQCAGRNGKAFPRQTWLAKKLGLSRQAVNTHIAELKENGLIETESRGYGRSLSYYFLWHEKIGNWANVLEEDNDPTPSAKGPDTSCQKGRHRKHNIKTNTKKVSCNRDILSNSTNEKLARQEQLEAPEPKEQAQHKLPVQPTNLFLPDFKKEYQNLHKTGFGQDQVNQVYQALFKAGVPTQEVKERLSQSFSLIEKVLSSGPLLNQYGLPVANLKSYLFVALRETGQFNPPRGWKDPKIVQLEQAKRRLAAEKQQTAEQTKRKAEKQHWQEREASDQAFTSWFSTLTQDDLQRLMQEKAKDKRSTLIRDLRLWLRTLYWPKHIKTKQGLAYG